ncbi:tyrosine-type recombinase/integrase [Streptomyces sp. NPDC020742]|uniref:tyrosine-type recombinase/integrase n=1 Tax=unclassified Streptomyces TaxID=2593676 RepID=UPI0033D897F6
MGTEGQRYCEEIDLPPVRLHGLRHGAATLAHPAGADLKDIQEVLGHSSIAITADTYTSPLPETDRAIAEAAARLVPRSRKPNDAGSSEANPQADAPSAHANAPGRIPRGRRWPPGCPKTAGHPG